jgi:hypothetical protein
VLVWWWCCGGAVEVAWEFVEVIVFAGVINL